jgi:hypothetical protein
MQQLMVFANAFALSFSKRDISKLVVAPELLVTFSVEVKQFNNGTAPNNRKTKPTTILSPIVLRPIIASIPPNSNLEK